MAFDRKEYEELEQNTVRLVIRAKNNKLLETREKLNFTQLQMAQYCDVGLNYYQQAETLKKIPVWAAKRIADTIELEVEQLFPGWSNMIGEAFNNKDSYYLMDDHYAQNVLSAGVGTTKLLTESFNTELNKLLNIIGDERTVRVIKKSFGIGIEKSLTLEEIGAEENLSKERIRQIKELGLRRLRQRGKRVMREYLQYNFAEEEG